MAKPAVDCVYEIHLLQSPTTIRVRYTGSRSDAQSIADYIGQTIMRAERQGPMKVWTEDKQWVILRPEAISHVTFDLTTREEAAKPTTQTGPRGVS